MDRPEAAFGEPLYGTNGWNKLPNAKKLLSLVCFWTSNEHKTTLPKIIASLEESFPKFHAGSSGGGRADEALAEALDAVLKAVNAPSNERDGACLSDEQFKAVARILCPQRKGKQLTVQNAKADVLTAFRELRRVADGKKLDFSVYSRGVRHAMFYYWCLDRRFKESRAGQ